MRFLFYFPLLFGFFAAVFSQAAALEKPFHRAELIFPLEHWHNHGSCIVETPKGDLIVCWFHGSGERTADDVKIEGARKRKGDSTWSKRFTMADTPDYPDTNCAMVIDPQERLWLLWPTILANRWETALMKYHIATDYHRDGPPKWEKSEILHVTPPPEFEIAVSNYLQGIETILKTSNLVGASGERVETWIAGLRSQAADKLHQEFVRKERLDADAT